MENEIPTPKRPWWTSFVTDIIIGGLTILSLFIVRYILCEAKFEGPDWLFYIIFFSPVVLIIILFGKLHALINLLLFRFFGVPVPEASKETWDYFILALLITFGFVMVLFASACP